jgi:hypothetical protein
VTRLMKRMCTVPENADTSDSGDTWYILNELHVFCVCFSAAVWCEMAFLVDSFFYSVHWKACGSLVEINKILGQWTWCSINLIGVWAPQLLIFFHILLWPQA